MRIGLDNQVKAVLEDWEPKRDPDGQSREPRRPIWAEHDGAHL
jgi:hypothetical protein